MAEFRTCQGDWPGVLPHSRRLCHEPATVEVAGQWLCLAHATRNLNEILTTFGQHEEDCWTEPVRRAQKELRGLREALCRPAPSGVDVEAVVAALREWEHFATRTIGGLERGDPLRSAWEKIHGDRLERTRVALSAAAPKPSGVDVPSDGTRERLTRLLDKLERQLDVDDDDAWALDRTDIEWIRTALSAATKAGGV